MAWKLFGLIAMIAPGSSRANAQESSPKVADPKPTFEDVHYGPHPNQVLDFWKADSDRPTALVV